jgi:hypothetical protein
MNSRVKDMTGKRCGLLTVTAHAGSIRNGNSSAALWECQFDCGNALIVVG